MERTHNWTTEEWVRADGAHHMHPFCEVGDIKQNGSKVITDADGVYVTDSDGNRYLDGMAALWCTNVGYGRKELAEAAYEQMVRMPFYNTFFKSTTMPAVELSQTLAELAPEHLNHVFYASSGSEANDTIVRMVRHYWNVRGKPNKKTFISREYAYHGSTMAAASLGGMDGMHKLSDLPLPGFAHVMPPYHYVYGKGMDEDAFGLAAAKAVEDKIVELGADNVGAFIGEPIMGAGGVIIPPKTYWPEIQRICKEHDILLIADEVICGFGRTGNWFGSDALDIAPDLMPIAKGLTSGYLPLSGVFVHDRIIDTLMNAGEFQHGFTYSGHPVSSAVALANIDIIKNEGLVEKVRDETGPYIASKLEPLKDHPLVGEIRHIGMFGALELSNDKANHGLFEPMGEVGIMGRNNCYAEGLIMRPVRDSLVFSPPLVISTSEIDEMIEKLGRALDKTWEQVQDRL